VNAPQPIAGAYCGVLPGPTAVSYRGLMLRLAGPTAASDPVGAHWSFGDLRYISHVSLMPFTPGRVRNRIDATSMRSEQHRCHIDAVGAGPERRVSDAEAVTSISSSASWC
jgi:hypothetical protein